VSEEFFRVVSISSHFFGVLDTKSRVSLWCLGLLYTTVEKCTGRSRILAQDMVI
jgi:hypothetical protein